MFFDVFRGYRFFKLICLNSLDIRSETRRQFLIKLHSHDVLHFLSKYRLQLVKNPEICLKIWVDRIKVEEFFVLSSEFIKYSSFRIRVGQSPIM